MAAGLEKWHFVCGHCGLEKSTLTPKINESNPMNEPERATALRTLRQQNFTTLLTWLARQYPAGFPPRPRMLEVGCAHGWFMEQAQATHDVLGIEPDAAIFRETRAKGLPVRHGFFPDALADDDMFDVIVFNDVLEHIPDAPSMLAHCRKHLTDNGHVVINAPSSEGIFYRTSKWMARLGLPQSFGRMWQLDLPSPHLYYFNTRTISDCARNTGFSLQGVTALPSITTEGLTERISYAGQTSALKTRLMALCITALMPLVRISRPDIEVWLLRKSSDMQETTTLPKKS